MRSLKGNIISIFVIVLCCSVFSTKSADDLKLTTLSQNCTKPCQNKGVCSNLENGYTCRCSQRFFGQHCEYKSLNSEIFINSVILDKQQSKKLIKLINLPTTRYQKIHQGNIDGFSGQDIRATFSKFNNTNGYLFVFKSNYSNVFGALIQNSFNFNDKNALNSFNFNDKNAFLFSLINKLDTPVQMNVKNLIINPFSLYPDQIYFSFGNELSCVGLYCTSDLGYRYSLYECPNFLTRFDSYNNSVTTQTFLGGAYKFKLDELEVYSINVDPCLIHSCENGGICSTDAKRQIICSCIDSFYGEKCQFNHLNSKVFLNSTILNNKNSQKLVDLIGFKTGWKLVFRASEDGFDPEKLRRSKSGGIRNTITIIKTSNSFIFGGFTSADWSPVNGLENTFKYDENAFLFSLVNDFNTSVRMNITQPSSPAIMTGVNSGLIFGKAESISIPYFMDIDSSDLHIDFIMTQGYSDIGKSYQLPAFLSDPKIRPDISKFFLAGSNIFYPVDIEVYSTVDQCLFNTCKNGGICSQNSSGYNCSCTNDSYGKNCQFIRLNSAIFKNSTILTNKQSKQLEDLISLNNSSNASVKLLYQGSIDGFSFRNYHSKCANTQASLIVAKSKNNNIFGAYTEAFCSINAGSIYDQQDANAFLFSLVNRYNRSVIMNIINPKYAVRFSSYDGPEFLQSLQLLDYSSQNGVGHMRSLRGNFPIPSFLDTNEPSNNVLDFFGGYYNFELFDIELYSVSFIDPCSIHSCKNGGICIPKGREFTCSCINGFIGQICAFKRVASKFFPNSTFLTDDLSMKLLNLTELTSITNPKWRLIYQASVDGFDSFHSKCDGVRNTLLIVKSNKNYIFGGYTTADWSSSEINYGVKYDADAFLFSLVNEFNSPVKMKILKPEKAIISSVYTYISFYEFRCDPGNKEVSICSSYLGSVYEKYPFGYPEKPFNFPSQNNFPYLFQAVEIEVYTNN